jgi:hypothetical protein
VLHFNFEFFCHRSPSTICGSTITEHTTVVTTSFPIFDQFHIVLATIKLVRLNNTPTTTITPDRVSIVLLNQKHVYNGIVFKLFELYGIDNHPSKSTSNHNNERRKGAARKKSLIRVVTTPTIDENQPFLNG